MNYKTDKWTQWKWLYRNGQAYWDDINGFTVFYYRASGKFIKKWWSWQARRDWIERL